MIKKNEERLKVTVNGIAVSYIDEGPKGRPVVIFIHGFPFNKSMWENQVEAIKKYFRVIAYDIRGHGNTDHGNEDLSIELFVKDLMGLIGELKAGKCILCGLSMGGYIALNAIENYPEHFIGLVLSDTQCNADSPEAKEKRLQAIESINTKGRDEYAIESIKNLFAHIPDKENNTKIKTIKEMIMQTPVRTLSNTLLALSKRTETCSNLHRIKIPVLIMVGEADKITPPSKAELMHEKLPDSILHLIENAGHISNIDNADVFNKHLKKFLGQFEVE